MTCDALLISAPVKPPWLRRLNTAARALAPALLAGVLAACSSLSPPDATSIDGRLAVQVEASGSEPARSMSAPFTLRGDEKAGSFEIATPLGTMLARATWQPSAATLKTIDAERHYATLDELASGFTQRIARVAHADGEDEWHFGKRMLAHFVADFFVAKVQLDAQARRLQLRDDLVGVSISVRRDRSDDGLQWRQP